MQLATVILTSDPLTSKLIHGVLVSQGPFLPCLVFLGLFVFPLGGGTGQTDGWTDRQTDGQDQYMMGHPSRKDGPIKSFFPKNPKFVVVFGGKIKRSHQFYLLTWKICNVYQKCKSLSHYLTNGNAV